MGVVARLPDRRAESYLLWSLGDLHCNLGDFKEALKLYRRALEILGNGEPSLRCSVLTSLATLRLWQGNYAECLTRAEEAVEIAAAHGMPREGGLAQAIRWTAEAQSGEALANLDHIAADLRERGAKFELMRVLGLCASVAVRCGDTASARSYIRAAVEVAEEVGTAQPLAAECLHQPDLRQLVTRGQHRLNRDLKCLTDARSIRNVGIIRQADDRLPYILHVLTLGQEKVRRDGRPVPSSAWRASTARRMFFYILFQGRQSPEP